MSADNQGGDSADPAAGGDRIEIDWTRPERRATGYVLVGVACGIGLLFVAIYGLASRISRGGRLVPNRRQVFCVDLPRNEKPIFATCRDDATSSAPSALAPSPWASASCPTPSIQR